MRIQFIPNKKIRIIFYEWASHFRTMYGVPSHKPVARTSPTIKRRERLNEWVRKDVAVFKPLVPT